MWDRFNIVRYVGSVVTAHHGTKTPNNSPNDNSTSESGPMPPINGPPNKDDNFTEVYMIIVIILSTLLPLICVILSAVFARKIWVKFHDQPSETPIEEGTAQNNVKSSRTSGSTRKSSRSGSRVSKTDPNSRDQLIPKSMQRRPSMRSTRRKSSLPLQEFLEETYYGDHPPYGSSPLPHRKENSIDNPLEESSAAVEDVAKASSSQEGKNTEDIDDEGGFASSRSSFRNHSLKVSDGEDSEQKLNNHHRSHSDAGRNRRKSEQPDSTEIETQLQPSTPSGIFLSTPGTKIRKCHSVRYKSSETNTGTRPRLSKDDCTGEIKRKSALDIELMHNSPQLMQRHSPHQFHQEEHHPQVHHSGQSNQSGHPSSTFDHYSNQAGHHTNHSSHHPSQSGHSSSLTGHHSTSHSSHYPNQSAHRASLHISQSSHHSGSHHSSSSKFGHQSSNHHKSSHVPSQQTHPGQSNHSRHFSMRRQEPSSPASLPPPPANINSEVDAEALDAMADEIVDMLVKEEEAASFELPDANIQTEEQNEDQNQSYQYDNQLSNQYPLNYHGGVGFPANTSYSSAESRAQRLHITSHQVTGSSPPVEEDNPSLDRKKSLTCDFEILQPEIQPMPVL